MCRCRRSRGIPLTSRRSLVVEGYKVVDHEVLLSEFCQEVVVPVEYGPPTSRKLKLKYKDVQEVLKYRPDT